MKKNLQIINVGGDCIYCGRSGGDHKENDECAYEVSIQKYDKKDFFDNHFYYSNR